MIWSTEHQTRIRILHHLFTMVFGKDFLKYEFTNKKCTIVDEPMYIYQREQWGEQFQYLMQMHKVLQPDSSTSSGIDSQSSPVAEPSCAATGIPAVPSSPASDTSDGDTCSSAQTEEPKEGVISFLVIIYTAKGAFKIRNGKTVKNVCLYPKFVNIRSNPA